MDFEVRRQNRFLNFKVLRDLYRQNFESDHDSPRQLLEKLQIKYIKMARFSHGHNLNVVCRAILH